MLLLWSATADGLGFLMLMLKPAFLFDGRNILPHSKLKDIGFKVYAIGKKA